MLLTLAAFALALGLLIAIHEYGHYRMALACGVKVLRFSVGFGKPLLRWRPRRQRPGQDTEFVIAAFPLGGYVQMLDEREAPVSDAERHRAFNTQPLRARALIVAAGPVANLLLAVLLYAGVNWIGVQEPVARLASPLPGSLALQAGLQGGEWVRSASLTGEEPVAVRSFDDLRWRLMQAALEGRDLRLEVASDEASEAHGVTLELSRLAVREADAQLFHQIGIVGPWTQPVLGEVTPGDPADRAGLRKGDLVLAVGAARVVDAQQLRELIRASVRAGQGLAQDWQVQRAGRILDLTVTPAPRDEAGRMVGRIGAFVGAPPAWVTVRYGAWEGAWRGLQRTGEVAWLSLRMMGRMVVGQASLKNLSGPLTIADYAGKSASLGLVQYLVFLALISVSLGVLNLLPLPVLDGGHLMYYLWEGLTGRCVSPAWMDRLQRGGVAVLLAMMSIAVFNDVTRLLG